MARWRSGRPEGPLTAFSVFIVAATVALDQAAKAWATATLANGETIDLLPILALLRVGNTGIAFSAFADWGGALIGLSLVVSVAVVLFWVTARDGGRLAAMGFAFILGGAIGNLIDRIRLGYVVDFLWLHLGDTTLFVFNLADAALTLGPILLVIAYVWPARTAAAG